MKSAHNGKKMRIRHIVFLVLAAGVLGCGEDMSVKSRWQELKPGVYVSEKSVAIRDMAPDDVLYFVNGEKITKADYTAESKVLEGLYSLHRGRDDVVAADRAVRMVGHSRDPGRIRRAEDGAAAHGGRRAGGGAGTRPDHGRELPGDDGRGGARRGLGGAGDGVARTMVARTRRKGRRRGARNAQPLRAGAERGSGGDNRDETEESLHGRDCIRTLPSPASKPGFRLRTRGGFP